MIELRWLRREVIEKPDAQPYIGEFLQCRYIKEWGMVGNIGGEPVPEPIWSEWQDVPTEDKP